MALPYVVDTAVHEAAHLVVGSDVMAVVAVVVSAGAWVAAGWLQARAAAPSGTHGSVLGAAPLLMFGAIRRDPSLPVVRSATAPASLVAMAVTVTSLLLLPAAVAAATFLLVSGHVPAGQSAWVVGASLVLASGGAAVTTRRVRACDGRRDWMARRGPHVGLAVLAGEALLLGSSLLVAAAVTHTENSVVSFLDIVCAALIARAMSQLRHPPAGAVVADLTYLLLLVAVGVSLPASLGIVAVWRMSAIAAWALMRAAAGRRTPGPPLVLAESPTGSAVGEWTHRAAFRAVGLMPTRLRDRVRKRLFDGLFSISDDPWGYDDLPYERRKRTHLLRQLPARAAVVVDVGCADGHVISAIGYQRPHALVIGVDISELAVEAARRRTASLENITVLRGSVAEAAVAIREFTTRPVDVLILSEVLYYLGTPAQVERDLRGLRPLLAVDAQVILVHPDSDANALHPPALAALDCELLARVPMADSDRPVVVDIGCRGSVPAP